MEPRGHRSMFVAALIAPGVNEIDYGVVFMDANTYPDMCGHATIGVATTLFELGLVGPEQPDYTGTWEFGLRTPAGRIELRATLLDGRCEGIAFRPRMRIILEEWTYRFKTGDLHKSTLPTVASGMVSCGRIPLACRLCHST
jgi:proline racemase